MSHTPKSKASSRGLTINPILTPKNPVSTPHQREPSSAKRVIGSPESSSPKTIVLSPVSTAHSRRLRWEHRRDESMASGDLESIQEGVAGFQVYDRPNSKASAESMDERIREDGKRRRHVKSLSMSSISSLNALGTPKSSQGVYASLNRPAVVIDNGSGFIKSGFGTDPRPMIYTSAVGRPKYRRVIAGSRRLDKFIIGKKFERLKGILKISYPNSGGVVSDWDHMESIWKYTYDELRTTPDRHSLLMTEPPLYLMKNRLNTAEILYESMHVPALSFQLPQVLGLYAAGNTTGLVLDSGDTYTSAVPIYDGRYNPGDVYISKLAGRAVTDYLARLLRLGGCNLTTSAEMEEVKRYKHKQCQTAFNLETAAQDFDGNRVHEGLGSPAFIQGYRLPDGKPIRVGLERFQAPELLFNPALNGKEEYSIQEVVINAINKCKLEQRRSISSQIIVQGGSTTSKGFELRLMSAIRRIKRLKGIKIKAPERRVEQAWQGGALLSTLSFFQDLCVKREDFLEYGAQIFHKRKAKDGVTKPLI